jgi:hypothetical protein
MVTDASLGVPASVPLEDPLELVLPLVLEEPLELVLPLPLVDPLPLLADPLLLVLPLEVPLPPLVEPPELPPDDPPLVLLLVASAPASPDALDESPQPAGAKQEAARQAAAKERSTLEAVRSFGIAVPLDQALEELPNRRSHGARVRQ